ncbi:efflux RND transporter periplasmic adaptor subunit [Gloeocapsa sp. PCC 73106]|uniref:efflux RND transporter periplasmic adaptor subunit n=1 Tax=Gloeocapsa sp. PCC 73106 TaxID=102232 RepID=UPI001EE64751|nr:efflux RND transporter periplasmic adaptor subunit [Gloeocapsa sp. PCC 73106]
MGCSREPEATAPQAIPVKLETLESSTLITSSEFVGSLRATQRVSLAPRISGRILQILVPSGTEVALGTPILLLEPTQQEEQVNARRATVQSARADLTAAQSQLSSAEAQKAQAEANLERAKADLANVQSILELAQINFKRAQFLVEEGVVSQAELDVRTNDLQTSQASFNAQEKAIIAEEQAVRAAEQGIMQAKANIERTQAQIAVAEGELGVVTVSLDDNQVLAPINGVVGDFPVKVGDFVNIGQELTTLTNNQEFDLRIFVPVERRAELALGLPVEIVEGDGSEGLTGKITFISPTVDQGTQSILTEVTFDNNGNLRDDQFVTVRIIWDQQAGVLIPTTAVSTLGSQKFVYVAETGENADLVARQTPIQVGAIQGQAYQVISGVEAGDRIAVSRILDLSDGRPIAEETTTSQTN